MTADGVGRRRLTWLLLAPMLANALLLLYGASFTLTLTVLQAFSAAGYTTVKEGVARIRSAGAVTNPEALQKITAGLYAGGLAALTVLRNEAAAAVAIGVDMGKRVAAVLDGWCCAAANASASSIAAEELASLDEDKSPTSPHTAAATSHASASWQRRWAATLLLGLCVGVFVLLACVYVHSTRVASLCVLAAQSLVESGAPLLGEAYVRQIGPGARFHAVAVGALTALGMLVQFLLYIAPPDAWYLPNGAAIPTWLRSLLSVPLALENALEEVRLACKCDFGRLQGYVVGAKSAAAVATAVSDV